LARKTPAQKQLEIQSKALEAILDAADRICVTPPLEEHHSTVVLSGNAKAKLNGVITKIADLGIEGAAAYTTENAKGVAQAKLADALKTGNDCKLTVLTTLKAIIPGLTGLPQTEPSASNSPDIEFAPPTLLQNQQVPGGPNGYALGMILFPQGTVRHAAGQTLEIVFHFLSDSGHPLSANPQQVMYHDRSGAVAVVIPPGLISNDSVSLGTHSASIPYWALNLPSSNSTQTYTLSVVAEAYLDNEPLKTSPPASFEVTF